MWPFTGRGAGGVLDLDKAGSDGTARRRPDADTGLVTALARETFPDNLHNSWRVLQTLELGEQTYVMVEPDPDDVGYSRFVFLLVPGTDTAARCVATYCLEADAFPLLCKSRDCPSGVPSRLTWTV